MPTPEDTALEALAPEIEHLQNRPDADAPSTEWAAQFAVESVPYVRIQFHRPAHAPLGISARLLPGGNRVKFVEVVLSDRDGNHCATAQGTMIVGGARRPQSGESE